MTKASEIVRSPLWKVVFANGASCYMLRDGTLWKSFEDSSAGLLALAAAGGPDPSRAKEINHFDFWAGFAVDMAWHRLEKVHAWYSLVAAFEGLAKALPADDAHAEAVLLVSVLAAGFGCLTMDEGVAGEPRKHCRMQTAVWQAEAAAGAAGIGRGPRGWLYDAYVATAVWKPEFDREVASALASPNHWAYGG